MRTLRFRFVETGFNWDLRKIWTILKSAESKDNIQFLLLLLNSDLSEPTTGTNSKNIEVDDVVEEDESILCSSTDAVPYLLSSTAADFSITKGSLSRYVL